MIKTDTAEVSEPIPASMKDASTANGHSEMNLSEALLTDEDVRRIGEAKYHSRFCPIVNTSENYNKFLLLDVVTDEYHIGEDLLELIRNAKEHHSGVNFYVTRTGRDAVFHLR